jgi:RNA polymerase sigma-70 factor (ECF subfamily)
MFLRRKKQVDLADEALVLGVREGDREALGVLWDRYAHLLYGVGMKYLKDPEVARDAVMEVFTTLGDRLRKHTVASFRPWLHVVMRNHCLQLLRRGGHHVAFVDLDDGGSTAYTEEMLERERDLQRLEAAIERLDPSQRTCIRLFHLERKSYAEVAEATGLGLEQVRSHLQNGRRNLRNMLGNDADRNT